MSETVPASKIPPIQTLFEAAEAEGILTEELAHTYGGNLALPTESAAGDRPYVICNFVVTLDGVVTYNLPGHTSGGEISGSNPADRFIMGVLRSCADVVILGAGTLEGERGQPRTADQIFPDAAEQYARQRERLKKPRYPANAIVTASGEINLSAPLFHNSEVDVIIVTTDEGARQLQSRFSSQSRVHIRSVGNGSEVAPRSVLQLLQDEWKAALCLHEGGPHLMGSFVKEGLIDELFLTLSPRIAGRDAQHPRPGLEQAQAFGPEDSPRLRLLSLKQQGSFLFSRYHF